MFQIIEGKLVEPFGVGVIGGSSTGWASLAHLPAIAASTAFELRALSTSRRSSAEAASARHGVPGYDNHHDLIAHPGVDLVVVAVKVTDHLDLVSAALDAGKMVYSEWPLGVGVTEARQLVERAEQAGVRTVIGLQGRYAPAVLHARDLIQGGYLGEVLGTDMVGSGMVWGGEVSRSQAYWYDDANGASPLTSPTIHALDPLHFVLGEFDTVLANLVVGRRTATITEDGTTIPVSVADQVSVIGTLTGGAAASVFYRGGASRGENFRWEINGTDGELIITSDWGNMQTAELTLRGGRAGQASVEPISIPESYVADVPAGLAGTPAANVARLYARLAQDLTQGTRTVPDFAHGLRRHQLVDAIEQASVTGVRQDQRTGRAA